MLLSVVGAILCPLLPLLIEWLKTGVVKHDSYLITAAVMSAALLVSSEHNFFRAFYLAFFIIALVLDVLIFGGPIASGMDTHSGQILLAVVILHFGERVEWHLVLDRPFPDSLRSVRG